MNQEKKNLLETQVGMMENKTVGLRQEILGSVHESPTERHPWGLVLVAMRENLWANLL